MAEGLSFLDEFFEEVFVGVLVGGICGDGCVGAGDPVFWVILFDGDGFVEEGVVCLVGDAEAALSQESVDAVALVSEERSLGEACHRVCVSCLENLGNNEHEDGLFFRNSPLFWTNGSRNWLSWFGGRGW